LAVPANFLAIDFETADYWPDSACAVGVALVRDREVAFSRSWLIRPPRAGFIFTKIHGICWEDVAGAPTFAQLWPELAPLMQDVDALVAHNAGFDRRVLSRCAERAKIDAPAMPFLCTLQLARRAWDLASHSLPAVCRHLGIPLTHHDARSDAEACARIALAV